MLLMFFSLDQADRDLVEDLYINFSQKFFNYGLSLVKNKEDAEEALSLTYIKIMENLEKIRSLPEEKIESYCFVIYHNKLMDIIRYKNKLSPIEEIEKIMDDTNPSPYDQVEKKLFLEDLDKHLQDLDQTDRNLLAFRYKYSLGYKEIALLLNISPEAARKRKERLIKSLEIRMKGGK
ncbi:MAG: sigma-70 family RNA polymerase sigma factor [Bacillota bacterium]|nr:sigma-70 family RNA polymerase sigma factor [Bacillota bacterium]